MSDPTKAFDAENGFFIDEGTGIWIGGGDSVPSVNAPEGSRYFRTSPIEHYIQDGPGENNNWIIDSGGADNLGNHTATESLKMEDFPIENPSRIDYQENATAPAHLEGRTFYDKEEKTLAVYNDESDVTHQLGQEGYVRVYNNSGITINNGKAVYITGVEGTENRPTVDLAQSDSETTAKVMGLATHDIENNTFGYVTYWGRVNDIDTSSCSPGDLLYLNADTAGGVTPTLPNGSDIPIQVGYCVKSDALSGVILVAIKGIADARIFKPTIVQTFQSSAAPYISVTSASYTIVSSFIYSGSSTIFTPTVIKAALSRSSTSTCDLRIYDMTNSQVIAEITNQVLTTSTAIYGLGTVSNVPSGEAVWEVQVARASGGGSVEIHGITIS